MAEWTPVKRAKLYSLLGEGDLETAVKLAEPHVDLRQGDFAPQDKKALKAFARKTKDNRKIHERIAGLLAHKNGTMRRLGTICFGALDEFPVELILRELRNLLFHMKTKRKELKEGQFGGMPKEFEVIFDALTRAAWRFPTDKVLLFVLEFSGQAIQRSAQAIKEYRERDNISDEMMQDESNEEDLEAIQNASGVVEITIPTEISWLDEAVGDGAANDVWRLRDMWIEKSANAIRTSQGYEKAIEWLDAAAGRIEEISKVSGVLGNVIQHLIREEAEKRSPKELGRGHQDLTACLLSYSIINENLVKYTPRTSQSLYFVASKLNDIAEESRGLLALLKRGDMKWINLRLSDLKRAQEALNQVAKFPAFNPTECAQKCHKPEDAKLGWEIYQELNRNDGLNKPLDTLVEILIPHFEKEVEFKDLNLVSLAKELIRSSGDEKPKLDGPDYNSPPPFLADVSPLKRGVRGLADVFSFEEFKVFARENVKMVHSPVHSHPLLKSRWDYQGKEFDTEEKILEKMTERVLRPDEFEVFASLLNSTDRNWLQIATSLPLLISEQQSFRTAEAWEGSLVPCGLSDLEFIITLMEKVAGKSFPAKLDRYLMTLGHVAGAITYTYLCCSPNPNPKMESLIRRALPLSRSWFNIRGAVERMAVLLVRLIDCGRAVKPWWSDLVVYLTALIADTETKLGARDLEDGRQYPQSYRMLGFSCFMALDLFRKIGNEKPIREFCASIGTVKFQGEHPYFLDGTDWDHDCARNMVPRIYYHCLGDRAIPALLVALERGNHYHGGSLKPAEKMHFKSFLARAMEQDPNAVSDHAASHMTLNYESLAPYLDHPKLVSGVAARLIRPFESDPKDVLYLEHEIDWAFNHILANPKRIAASGRTVLDLLKRGLWVNQPRFVKATIDRFERAVEAGVVEPQAAYHAMEEILTVSNPGVMNAAIGVMKRIAKKHKGLTLAKPELVKEFVARDPEKYTKAFKGLI